MQLPESLPTPAATEPFKDKAAVKSPLDHGGFENFMDTAQSPQKSDSGEKPPAKAKPVARKNHGGEITATTTSKPTLGNTADKLGQETAGQLKPDAVKALGVKSAEVPTEKVSSDGSLPTAELSKMTPPVLVTLPLMVTLTANTLGLENVSPVESEKPAALAIGKVSGANVLPTSSELMRPNDTRQSGVQLLPSQLPTTAADVANTTAVPTVREQLC